MTCMHVNCLICSENDGQYMIIFICFSLSLFTRTITLLREIHAASNEHQAAFEKAHDSCRERRLQGTEDGRSRGGGMRRDA